MHVTVIQHAKIATIFLSRAKASHGCENLCLFFVSSKKIVGPKAFFIVYMMVTIIHAPSLCMVSPPKASRKECKPAQNAQD